MASTRLFLFVFLLCVTFGILSCDASHKKNNDRCKAVLENKAWSGECRNLTDHNDVKFCKNYVDLVGFDSCVYGKWSLSGERQERKSSE